MLEIGKRRFGARQSAAFLLVGLLIVFAAADLYTRRVEADMQASVIRLHIIANSDSAEDQRLKLKVRDRIVRETGQLFAEGDLAQSSRAVVENLPWFEELARDELAANGCEDEVHVTFGVSYFPTKTYQDVSFPAGNYTALRIVIGKGEGQNWWCVLFPPLCFVGMAEPYMDEEARKQLRQALPEEEYELVTEQNGELPVQFKFKLVELWQEAKNRFSGRSAV